MLSCPQKTDNSFVKFADDTYLVIPAASADTRVAELGHIAAWSAVNNLRLNKSKTREVVFYETGVDTVSSRRRRCPTSSVTQR